MPSLIPGYNYDIFISYRQKDNKYDGWVTEFVDNLKKELEATFKEDISVYFDINPHDGLLETHDVDESLKEKLKCLIFIPVISKTYCDPNSFAWEHEFKAFIDRTPEEQFGLKVKLPGGNVASRVLPVRIYDLSKDDINLCEAALGGVLRGIEFIYKSAGVNRPLRANEDHPRDNLYKTYYRDQINKLSFSITEIIQGLRTVGNLTNNDNLLSRSQQVIAPDVNSRLSTGHRSTLPWKKIMAGLAVLTILAGLFLVGKHFLKGTDDGLDSTAILDKAIQVVDPYNCWNNYSGKIDLHVIQPEGIKYDEFIEIQTAENYYKSTFIEGKTRIVRGIRDGRYFRDIDGNTNPDSALIKDYGLTEERINYMKNFQYCHFGLLMELKRSGLTLQKKVIKDKFIGKDCYLLVFSRNGTITNDFFKDTNEFTVYVDPKQFTVLGFASPDSPWGDIYIVCSDQVTLNGITFPFCKLYYKKINNSLLAINTFFKVE